MTAILLTVFLACALSPAAARAETGPAKALRQIDITAEAPVGGEEVKLLGNGTAEPVQDTKPAVSCRTKGTLIEDASWATSTDPGTTAPFSGTFAEGNDYAVAVIVAPADGYQIDGNTRITVNGSESDASFIFTDGTDTFALALSTVRAVRAPAETILRNAPAASSPAAGTPGDAKLLSITGRLLSLLFSGGIRVHLWILLILLCTAEALLLCKKRALAKRRK